MFKKENNRIMSLYAVTPVHAGSGSSMGVVDLPVQRERHTQWPIIQSTGVKGAMRAHFESFKDTLLNESEQIDNLTDNIFGTDNTDGESYAGAISVTDAKILAFPMRSNKAPFVWITCPAVLKRFQRDAHICGAAINLEQYEVAEQEAICLKGKLDGEILLEDFVVTVNENADCKIEGALIENCLLEKTERLLIVHDEVFKYAVESCTEVQAQIKINQESGTAEDGSLRYEELLPADTVMYSLMFYGPSRDVNNSLQAEMLVEYMTEKVINSHIQIGGDETVGRGIFEISWIKA